MTSRTLARFLLPVFSVLALMFVLWPAGQMGARGRAPNSLQPDPSAVFFTMVMQRNQPVSRGNLLILPSPNSHASINAKSGSSGGGGGHKGGGSSGGGTSGGGGTPCCGTLNLTFLTSPTSAYSPTDTVQTPTTTQPEAEEEIAADPNSASNLVAAISDFSSSSGYNNTKWVLSTAGGNGWSEESFVPTNSAGYLVTSDGQVWDANSDPVVAFDTNGNVYLSDLYLTIDAYGRITSEGLYVSTDTFNNLSSGKNFGATQPVLTNINNGNTFNIEDKPWIAVDNSGNAATTGNVYASWSHFTGCQNKYSPLYGTYVLTCSSDSIYFAYSTDHGKSWSTPVQISPGTQDGAVQGSQPAVGPDGKVYVAYEFFGSSNQRQQYLSVGTWSGTGSNRTIAFSTPFVASPVFNELTFAGCSTCTSSYRVNSFPNIAVGPAESTVNPSGNVYLVYGAQATSTSTAQVNLVACTSNCTGTSSFDGPANLDDNAAGEHFFPAISVDSNGVIDTSWFDTRNAPSTVPNPDDYLDVYGSYIKYDGSSFTASPNAQITSATYDASILDGWGDTSFIGDYIGIAATPNVAQPVWTNMAGALGYPTQGSLQTRTLGVP